MLFRVEALLLICAPPPIHPTRSPPPTRHTASPLHSCLSYNHRALLPNPSPPQRATQNNGTYFTNCVLYCTVCCYALWAFTTPAPHQARILSLLNNAVFYARKSFQRLFESLRVWWFEGFYSGKESWCLSYCIANTIGSTGLQSLISLLLLPLRNFHRSYSPERVRRGFITTLWDTVNVLRTIASIL